MKSVSALALATAVLGQGATVDDAEMQVNFVTWAQQHKKQIPLNEVFDRFETFKSNFALIEEHNENSGASFTLGLNEFADMNNQEFMSLYHGYKPAGARATSLYTHAAADDYVPQASVDWRAKKAVTAIKDQGQCGSCWAFSTVASTEGAVAIKTGKLTSFSEQQLMDCVDGGADSCNGGWMYKGLEWVAKNGGICTESSYPYTEKTGRSCKTSCTKAGKGIVTGYTWVDQNDAALTSAIDKTVVSVSIDAQGSAFQFYKKGVFDVKCGTSLDHGVTAVGYGTLSGAKYYIVKNSWGTSWGESGYILMSRGNNQCGITDGALYPNY